MSVTNFKPTLWEGGLLANFHSVSIAHLMSTAPTEINGEKVIFNSSISSSSVNPSAA